MTFATRVWCTTEFEGFHRWESAPEEVEFLRSEHRHVFKVRVEVAVEHHDRQVEFITLKRHVDRIIDEKCLTMKTITWSCETWALAIGNNLAKEYGYDVQSVEVSEDGENGATIRYD